MKNYEKKGIKSEQGFTMIELIIVIAIIGILSAILVPSFTTMSRKSKLRADIASVKQLQTQIDLYMAENDGKFPGKADATTFVEADALTDLVAKEYLNKSDVKDDKLNLQSNGATLAYNETDEHLQLKLVDKSKEAKAAQDVTGSDSKWIVSPVVE